MSNTDQQEEELAVLESIFADDCEVDREAHTVQVWVPSKGHLPCIVLRALLVPGYPSSDPPAVEIDAQHWSEDHVARVCADLEEQFVPGEVVLYQWIEYVKEAHDAYSSSVNPSGAGEGGAAVGVKHGPGGGRVGDESEGSDWQPGDEDDEEEDEDEEEDWGEDEGAAEAEGKHVDRAARASTSASPADTSLQEAVRPRIVSGQPLTERKSTFQAHVARVTSAEEARAVVRVLLESNKIRNAAHNIMAYRTVCEGRGTFYQDFDDDGEAAAGGRLLHLLQVADARDVVVVVTRWFGGVLLGPSRFTLINNTARVLLEEQGFIHAGGTADRRSRTSVAVSSTKRTGGATRSTRR